MKRLLVLAALIGTLVSVFSVVHEAGGLANWHGVLPSGQVDSLYYYARIKEVADGHLLIGNPYFFEHREKFTPGFFIPDIVAALPVMLGVPFDLAMALNLFVWSAAFLLLAFYLMRQLELPPWWAFGGTILAYVMAFAYIVRPVSLELIYPVFLAFLITLARFLAAPLDRKCLLWLSVITALSFYTYLLLAYIVVVTLGCVLLWFLLRREFKEAQALAFSGLFALILIIPFGVYSYVQMSDPFYAATYLRMGLVYTHLPAFEVFYYGRWILISLAILEILWRLFPNTSGRQYRMFWWVTGTGLFAGLILNVITGIDVSLAIHTGRFIFPWATLGFGAILYYVVASKAWVHSFRLATYVLAGLVLLLGIGIIKNIPPGPSFFAFNKDKSFAEKQSYAATLKWLEAHASPGSVVWANDSVSVYIPIMTSGYVLFQENAALHQVSDEELLERYLLSRSLGTLSREELKRDLGLYTGLGSHLQAFVENKRREVCRFLVHVGSDRACLPPTTATELYGEAYFEKLEKEFAQVKKDRTALLNNYDVAYLLVDTNKDKINIKQLGVGAPLYDDGRFLIFTSPFK